MSKISKRRFLREIRKHPLFWVLAMIWTILSALSVLPILLPPEKARNFTLHPYLPRWDWHIAVVGFLVIALCGLFESYYYFYRHKASETADLTEKLEKQTSTALEKSAYSIRTSTENIGLKQKLHAAEVSIEQKDKEKENLTQVISRKDAQIAGLEGRVYQGSPRLVLKAYAVADEINRYSILPSPIRRWSLALENCGERAARFIWLQPKKSYSDKFILQFSQLPSLKPQAEESLGFWVTEGWNKEATLASFLSDHSADAALIWWDINIKYRDMDESEMEEIVRLCYDVQTDVLYGTDAPYTARGFKPPKPLESKADVISSQPERSPFADERLQYFKSKMAELTLLERNVLHYLVTTGASGQQAGYEAAAAYGGNVLSDPRGPIRRKTNFICLGRSGEEINSDFKQLLEEWAIRYAPMFVQCVPSEQGKTTLCKLAVRASGEALKNLRVSVEGPKPEWMDERFSPHFPFRLSDQACDLNPGDTEYFPLLEWWVSAGGQRIVSLNGSKLEAPTTQWALDLKASWANGSNVGTIEVIRQEPNFYVKML